VFQESLHRIPQLKIAIQLKIEAISARILTKVLNSFVLGLREVCGFEGHDMEHV
jgi:hypothetical protein